MKGGTGITGAARLSIAHRSAWGGGRQGVMCVQQPPVSFTPLPTRPPAIIVVRLGAPRLREQCVAYAQLELRPLHLTLTTTPQARGLPWLGSQHTGHSASPGIREQERDSPGVCLHTLPLRGSLLPQA